MKAAIVHRMTITVFIRYRIVAEAHGDVQIASQAGQGACFTLLLPATEGEPADPAPARLQVDHAR